MPNEVYSRIDWNLLKRQKAELVKLGDRETTYEWIDGVLGFIDAIQDDADSKGYPVEYLTEEEIADEA